jgi:hypothetical protein
MIDLQLLIISSYSYLHKLCMQTFKIYHVTSTEIVGILILLPIFSKEIMTQCLHVCSPLPPPNQLTHIQESWCEHLAIKGHPTFVFFNFSNANMMAM